MNAPSKIVITSGRRMDQGKTSLTDNLVAPRLPNVVRVEIESASTGSSKPGVLRVPATQLSTLRDALMDLEDDQSLVCDVGGAEYADFMAEMSMSASTAARFDRFIFVMSAAGSIKQSDALESIEELITLGADPARVSVVFNFAKYVIGLEALRAALRSQFSEVFAAAEAMGVHICETPVIHSEAIYKTCFTSPEWNVSSLVEAPSMWDAMRAMKKDGKPIPDAMRALEVAQEQARSFGLANLDTVWAEILDAHAKVA